MCFSIPTAPGIPRGDNTPATNRRDVNRPGLSFDEFVEASGGIDAFGSQVNGRLVAAQAYRAYREATGDPLVAGEEALAPEAKQVARVAGPRIQTPAERIGPEDLRSDPVPNLNRGFRGPRI